MLDPNTATLLNQLGIDATTVETVLDGMLLLTIVTVAAAIPTGIIAKKKRRSVTGWVILALSIPVLPLLIVWLLPGRGNPDAGPPA